MLLADDSAEINEDTKCVCDISLFKIFENRIRLQLHEYKIDIIILTYLDELD